MPYDLAKITAELERVLPQEEFEHSLRSADYAVELAARFHLDETKARVAGLLHDYAKGLTADALLATAAELGIEPDHVERTFPELLHGPIAARLLPRRLGVTDEEVLTAVERHTLGAPGMSEFDKVIYLCDLLEPGRPWPELVPLRQLAERDLDRAFEAAYAHTIEYLVEHRRPIHPTTVAVWNWLQLGKKAGSERAHQTGTKAGSG